MDVILVYEKTTPSFTGVLKDENGDAIAQASINFFKATLYDKSAGTIINSREDVDLYADSWAGVDDMKATVDSSGNCTVRLAEADTPILTAANKGEVHVLQIVVKTTGSPQTVLVELFEHYVENLTKRT